MQEGAGESLAAAYDAYAPGLYRYALMLLANPAAAEDAVQQVFARLAARDDWADGVASIEAYLRTAVRNECYSALRLRQRDRPPHGARLLDVEPAGGGHDEERLGLEAILRDLPVEQREVVHMKVYEGHTFQQIADVTGVSPNTVASRYRYALQRLRTALREGGSHDA